MDSTGLRETFNMLVKNQLSFHATSTAIFDKIENYYQDIAAEIANNLRANEEQIPEVQVAEIAKIIGKHTEITDPVELYYEQEGFAESIDLIINAYEKSIKIHVDDEKWVGNRQNVRPLQANFLPKGEQRALAGSENVIINTEGTKKYVDYHIDFVGKDYLKIKYSPPHLTPLGKMSKERFSFFSDDTEFMGELNDKLRSEGFSIQSRGQKNSYIHLEDNAKFSPEAIFSSLQRALRTEPFEIRCNFAEIAAFEKAVQNLSPPSQGISKS